MNTAEIKLDMFRKIDNLKGAELERVYHSFLSLLNKPKKHILTSEERTAIEEALERSKNGKTFLHESVMNEAQAKYSKLKFK